MLDEFLMGLFNTYLISMGVGSVRLSCYVDLLGKIYIRAGCGVYIYS